MDWGNNITGRVTWRNNLIPEGANVLVAFLLGKGDQFYHTTAEGLNYFLGSLAVVQAQALEATATHEIPSRAIYQNGWDAWVMVGEASGEIRTISSGDRIVGLQVEDVNAYLRYHDAEWIRNALSVGEPPPAGEVTTFEVVEG